MTPSDDLQRLVERIEAAGEGSAQLDHAIGCALFPERESWPLYTTSLDAAMSLVPEGAWIYLRNCMGPQPMTCDLFEADVLPEGGKGRPVKFGRLHTTAPLALCAAALRARMTSDA